MLLTSPAEIPQRFFFDIFDRMNFNQPILALGLTIDKVKLEKAFCPLYSKCGRPAKPIRLMCRLLILKQMLNCNNYRNISFWLLSPYYQALCGETHFQSKKPCDRTDLVKFRQIIGVEGIKFIFPISVSLHKERA